LVVPYISMHGSTRIMVEHFVAACSERGIRAEQVNLVDADLGHLGMLLWTRERGVGNPDGAGGGPPDVSHVAIGGQPAQAEGENPLGHRVLWVGGKSRGAAFGLDPN
jgi:hypothetical protein